MRCGCRGAVIAVCYACTDVRCLPPFDGQDKDNDEVAVWGTCRDPAGLLSHDQLLHRIGGYDQERGVRVAGHRAYYLQVRRHDDTRTHTHSNPRRCQLTVFPVHAHRVPACC